MTALIPFPAPAGPAGPGAGGDVTSFHRSELRPILALYGRMVAAGEWRDYAITHRRTVASFAIFRRASEAPLYRIEKCPSLRARQGQWAVLGQAGQVLRRGHDLEQVLRVLAPKPRPVD
jgi:hypothetical protein